MASPTQAEQQDAKQGPWFLRSSFPAFFPSHTSLTASQVDFETYLETVRPSASTANNEALLQGSFKDVATGTECGSAHLSDMSTTADIREDLETMDMEGEYRFDNPTTTDHPFMKGLLSYQDREFQRSIANQIKERKNQMRTENFDIAYRSTTDPLLDLFTELEDVVSGPRLRELLEGAWKADAEMTLKIIFNARSIHLGKASRHTFYRCAGWLAKYHPQTLLANLAWLSRPVIPKKVEKKKDGGEEEDFEMVSAESEVGDENDPARFDVKNGVAHGYWKDHLNILALYVNGKLDVLANPRDILNVEQEKDRLGWPKTRDEAKTRRRDKRDARHETAVGLFHDDPVYRALHLTVARLFASQLKQDLAALRGGDASAKRGISLCAKWAPSPGRFHDKHTFVVSSVAEILHPASEFAHLGLNPASEDQQQQRQVYLCHAREAYRKGVSALRKHLEVVERDVTAGAYQNIKYDRVPSVAMHNYASLFATKDAERFEKYTDDVADGKARISGATLLPGKLIRAVLDANWIPGTLTTALATADGDDDNKTTTTATGAKRKRRGVDKAIHNAIVAETKLKVLEGQWNALVHRVRDSGMLTNAIAVADVSDSMKLPEFPDGTCPMDSSIALALLVAEVAQPPFGGAFITFAERPVVQRIDQDPSWTLRQKIAAVRRSDWGMRTDFEAVFTKLLLPMAVANKLAPADMVKRVFVFSDMQFDQARPIRTNNDTDTDTSFERARAQFREAGYELPELVFWNLAGGRAGYFGRPPAGGDPVAPKPVVARQGGTALVSGYSPGMLKVFLEGGSFEEGDGQQEEEEEEEEGAVMVEIGEDGEVGTKKKKRKLDPLSVVRKAVGHRAYRMLRVVD